MLKKIMSDLLIHKVLNSEKNFQELKLKNANYNTLKSYNNKIYTGMSIGGSHQWNYNNGKWFEIKKTPDKWVFSFNSVKTRLNAAPV
ncbi:MAG: hypothetical protein ACFFAT_09920, partial [Promethearchaeota archaeon]